VEPAAAAATPVLEPLTIQESLLRLVAAAVCGALLGFNREQHGKPAGLKTLTLVSVGAASFMLVSLELFLAVPDTDVGVSRVDLTRVVQGVVGGIGFLGAGSIIRARGAVVGTTTAATIWTVGAIGLACGLGNYRLALLVTAVAWMILVGFGFVERKWLAPHGDRPPRRDEPPTS
jgi:putative Mg2+ transporter-C (MgtC) family protein